MITKPCCSFWHLHCQTKNPLEKRSQLISINFTLKTSHSCLKKKGTFPCFPGLLFLGIFQGKQGAELLFVAEDVSPLHSGDWSPVVSLPTRVLAQMQLLDAGLGELGFFLTSWLVNHHAPTRNVPPLRNKGLIACPIEEKQWLASPYLRPYFWGSTLGGGGDWPAMIAGKG